MPPRLVCTLACRVQSARLYGKPLQLLSIEDNLSIIDYLLEHLKATAEIDETVLAVSAGVENTPFVKLAERRGLKYIIGDEMDVQGRLLAASVVGAADIIFRVTSECPFIYMSGLAGALQKHIASGASLTIIEGLPEGAYFELINRADLERAHNEGEERHRSELCTLYMSEHPEKFKLQILPAPEPSLKRPDIRITVDYPEDLIVVRELYKALKRAGEFISISDIIKYLDAHPALNQVNSWIDAGKGRIWN